jgi:hypothetical protein
MKKLNQQEKCKEQWKTIPYSSEHLWQGDIHGIPSGNCTKCGMAYWDYDQRFNKKVMTKGFMKKYLKLCQPSVVEKCKERKGGGNMFGKAKAKKVVKKAVKTSKKCSKCGK